MPFICQLPARKSDPKGRVRVARFDTCSGGCCDGRLQIFTAGKPTEMYAVTEFPCDFDGRAFRFEKLTAGTDKEADSYDLFLATRGHNTCDCKGFTRFGYCKHLDSIKGVIEQGAFFQGIDPDADHANTEPEDWAESIADQYEWSA